MHKVGNKHVYGVYTGYMETLNYLCNCFVNLNLSYIKKFILKVEKTLTNWN